MHKIVQCLSIWSFTLRHFLLFKCDPLTCRLWGRMGIGPITRLCQRRYSLSCGAVLTNLISLFKWICAPCSQRILRHRCVIVWILSQDNYASFCRNENKARKRQICSYGEWRFLCRRRSSYQKSSS